MPKGVYSRTQYHKDKLKVSRKGAGIYTRTKPVWNKGKKTGFNYKQSKRLKELYRKGKISPWNKGIKGIVKGYWTGKKRSPETIEKMRKINLGKTGVSACNWKGGLTSLQMLVRSCKKNRKWIIDVFQRDNFTCQYCGKRGGDLEVHHIKKFSIIIKEFNIKTYEQAIKCLELWNISNGQTLCKNCHNETKKLNN